jgi:hypothetical protein
VLLLPQATNSDGSVNGAILNCECLIQFTKVIRGRYKEATKLRGFRFCLLVNLYA